VVSRRDAFRVECHVTSPERPRIDLGTDHSLAAVTTITLKPTGETEIVGGLALGDVPGQIGTLGWAGLVQIPAVLLIASLVVIAAGWLPRWAATLSWLMLVGSILLGPLFSATLGLPGWVQNLSVFTHVPKVHLPERIARPRRQCLAEPFFGPQCQRCRRVPTQQGPKSRGISQMPIPHRTRMHTQRGYVRMPPRNSGWADGRRAASSGARAVP
jgi:hypothetical protein